MSAMMRKLFRIVVWSARKMLGLYGPADCQRGNCACLNASWCYFKRCENCDNALDASGKAFDTGRWLEDWDRCPDCGGDARP